MAGIMTGMLQDFRYGPRQLRKSPRTQKIGIGMALGAGAADVLKLMVWGV